MEIIFFCVWSIFLLAERCFPPAKIITACLLLQPGKRSRKLRSLCICSGRLLPLNLALWPVQGRYPRKSRSLCKCSNLQSLLPSFHLSPLYAYFYCLYWAHISNLFQVATVASLLYGLRLSITIHCKNGRTVVYTNPASYTQRIIH